MQATIDAEVVHNRGEGLINLVLAGNERFHLLALVECVERCLRDQRTWLKSSVRA
jgi:hypothetical protein